MCCDNDEHKLPHRRFVLAGLTATLLIQTRPSHSAPSPTAPFSFYAPQNVARLQHHPSTNLASGIAHIRSKIGTRTPHAMEYIHVEGTLPGEGIFDQSAEAMRDCRMARDIALNGLLNHRNDDLKQAANFVLAWAQIYQPHFNPIDETKFTDLMMAWDLIPNKSAFPQSDQVQSFWRKFATGYLAHPLRGRNAVNNWNSHRINLIAMAAFAVGDEALIERAASEFQLQLRNNISTNGLCYDFEQRDALRYVCYSLEPLLTTALAARAHGLDWWSVENKRLAKAVHWLVPYANGSKTHQEFVRSTVAFDAKRAEAGMKGYSGPFDRRMAELTMALAARLDPAIKAMSTPPLWLQAFAPSA